MPILGSLKPLGSLLPLGGLGDFEVPPNMPILSEPAILEAVAELLDATNAFDEVYLYSLPEDRGRKAGQLAAVAITPGRTVVEDRWDDAEGGEFVCRMTFNLTVLARDEDPARRDRLAYRLAAVAQNALNGASFGGSNVVEQTYVNGWNWPTEVAVERRVQATVQVPYTSPWRGFNAQE